jgi:CRISPR-associated protein Cas2
MIVMILEKVTASLRGELTRWLIEPHTGVFVGHVNAMVRQRLWDKCCKAAGSGGVVQIWSTNTEQHFAMRLFGNTQRSIIELEGLQLVKVPNPPESVQIKLQTTLNRATRQTT